MRLLILATVFAILSGCEYHECNLEMKDGGRYHVVSRFCEIKLDTVTCHNNRNLIAITGVRSLECVSSLK
jgi:hypothetical protein